MENHNHADSYLVIAEKAYGEIVEKKSRFIASLSPVDSEDEALAFLENIRKQYYDARHNCFAFIIGKNAEQRRYGDDGEPSGTAGRPMLETLQGRGLTNVAAVVTRYFGGTLLGTGGLARAYTQAVQAALESCRIVTMRYGLRYVVSGDYSLAGKLQYLFAKWEIKIEDTVYTDKAAFHILVPASSEEGLRHDIIEASSARAQMEKLGSAYYASDS